MVKSLEHAISLDCRTDLDFVTFLRHILTSGLDVNTPTSICDRANRCAEWIDQEQSIFKINHRDEFAMEWYKFKVISDSCVFIILVPFCFSGLGIYFLELPLHLCYNGIHQQEYPQTAF